MTYAATQGVAHLPPVEGSPRVLANRARKGAPLPAPSGANGAPPRPEGEETRGHDGGEAGHAVGCENTKEPESHIDVVRASPRIRLDFAQLSPEGARTLRLALVIARHRVVTGANAVARELFRVDSEALDAFMATNGGMPRGGEWRCPKLPSWGYKLVRSVVPELASSIAVVTSKRVHSDWGKKRWDALVKQVRSPVLAYTVTMPIEVHNGGCKLVQRGGLWWLDVALVEGRGNRVSLPLDVRDARHRLIVEKCASGDWKLGQPRLQEDSKRQGRWYVRLAYKRRVERVFGGKTLAVHRGIRNALVAVTSDGKQMRYDGADIEAFLRQMQKRRRSYQYCAAMSGRAGRGRKRILRPTEPLDRIAANWRNTKNQTIARRLIEWAAKHGCTHVVIEDLTGVRRGEPESLKGGELVYKRIQEWPFFDLASRIVSCAEELGMSHAQVEAAYISQRSPCCGHVAKENVDMRRWKQVCGECGRTLDLDVAAAMNVLARGEAKRHGREREYAELCSVTKVDGETARKRGGRSLKSQCKHKGSSSA